MTLHRMSVRMVKRMISTSCSYIRISESRRMTIARDKGRDKVASSSLFINGVLNLGIKGDLAEGGTSI